MLTTMTAAAAVVGAIAWIGCAIRRARNSAVDDAIAVLIARNAAHPDVTIGGRRYCAAMSDADLDRIDQIGKARLDAVLTAQERSRQAQRLARRMRDRRGKVRPFPRPA